MTLPPCVLWIDPGDMTGLARLVRGREFHAGEWAFRDAGDRIYGCCAEWKSGLWVGWERYRIDPRKPQTHAYDAIGMIGVARYFATVFGCVILPPAQPDERNTASPAALKAIGWWIPGRDDAQSAAQHLAAWLQRTGNTPPELSVRMAEARQRN